MQFAFTRLLAGLGAASLLAACSSTGGASLSPATNGALSPQSASQAVAASAARGTLDKDKEKSKKTGLTATPAALHFVSGDTVAQTVAIGGAHGAYAVTIAGTGNCPTVSPAKLVAKGDDEDEHGDHDGNHEHKGTKAPSTATITVTPGGAGPATCTITLSKPGDGDDEHGDHHGNNDNDGHHAAAALTIPVTVDAPLATPTPAPTCPPLSRTCL